jgi:hypothetical protein
MKSSPSSWCPVIALALAACSETPSPSSDAYVACGDDVTREHTRCAHRRRDSGAPAVDAATGGPSDAGIASPVDAGRAADGGTGPVACSSTLRVGDDLAAAVRSAPAGATICLLDGDHGHASLADIARTSFVTIRSAIGRGATLGATISNSDFIRLESLTFRGARIERCSTNIQIVGSMWAPDEEGIAVFDHGYSCPDTDKRILIDGNTFVDTRPAWSEGKIGIVAVNGVTFSNNLVEGQSLHDGGDGIQTGGECDNLVVTGNVFRDIHQAPCDDSPGVPHCDAIQYVGSCTTCEISGNWFDRVDVVLQHHDGTVPVRFTNNLVTHAAQLWAYDPQASGSVFEHNTFYDVEWILTLGRNGSGVSTSSGIVGRSNIFLDGVQPMGCTSSCTFSHNLARLSSENLGASQINAAPIFVGGAPETITTWAGWRLAPGSPGAGAGHDGGDVGALAFGGP